MPKTIRISDIVTYGDSIEMDSNYYGRTITAIMKNMRTFKCRASYSEYAPHLDFSPQGRGREVASGALWVIWQYCKSGRDINNPVSKENSLMPMLNMLVLKQNYLNDNVAHMGEAIMKGYAEEFGSLIDYDKYCDLQATLSELMLKNELINIID